MTKVTFETPTLASALQKAAKVAPTRGEAFDRAAGVLLKIDPDAENSVLIMATDLKIFYTEAVSSIEIEGPAVTWRIPAQASASVITGVGRGVNTVVLDDGLEANRVIFAAGRMKAKFNRLDPEYYPMWTLEAPEEMTEVYDFGSAIQQVIWAQASESPELKAVCLSGEYAAATDRMKLARTALATGFTEDCVIPADILSNILPKSGAVRIARDDTGFYIMPDDYTQIRTVVFDTHFPPVSRIIDQDFTYVSTINKADFLDMLNRAMSFVQGDRIPSVLFQIGRSDLIVVGENQEIGLIGDIIEAKGSAVEHKRLKGYFLPSMLRDGIGSCRSQEVQIYYNDPIKVLKISDGNNYFCAFSTRRGTEEVKKDE